MQSASNSALPLNLDQLRPGLRLAVGLSGGADSVALLRALAAQTAELGLVLSAAHLNHGLRGEESDRDQEFCRALAAQLGIEFHTARVDVAAEAAAHGESLEEAARRLRYGWFRELMSKTPLHAVATAHTRDDQAETVLGKLLRGAWTEGLGGIHPVVEFAEGRILRPLLGASRTQVEAYLHSLGQSWCEDSTNRELTFTRNRIRHELLPTLDAWNPRLREHLCQMAELARDEEAYWQAELDRLAPQLLMAGRPVRGGGRASSGEGLALDVTRLAALPVAIERRLLRYAAARLGVAIDFASTAALRALALGGRAGQKLPVEGGMVAERTPRELHLMAAAPAAAEPAPSYVIPAPGEIDCPAYGLCIRIEVEPSASRLRPTATLRPWRAGDRVWIRHSSGPRKVKEVLQRLKISGSERGGWPVLEMNGQILWLQGVEVEPLPGVQVTATPLD